MVADIKCLWSLKRFLPFLLFPFLFTAACPARADESPPTVGAREL